jgi:cell division transport system ATP-binding protein
MIKFNNVTKIYQPSGAIVLQNISFEIKDGEFISFIGKSGAGKTTLMRLILGIEKPTFGEIYIDQINIAKANLSKIQELRRKIGCIHQDYKLLSNKTVYENIAYIMAVEGKENEEIEVQVPSILEVIGLHEMTGKFPGELSGGEQQRLAVARALVNHPQIIIADEPTGNLDPYNSYEVISLLEKINKNGSTVILATHNREIINKLGKRTITLENGKMIRDEEDGRFII